MKIYIKNFLGKTHNTKFFAVLLAIREKEGNMRINLKMTYEELVKMQNSVAELPFYVTRKVGTEFKVYAYSHSSMSNGYVRKNATYTPIPYKGRFGVGFTVKSNNSSTRYSYKTYYIEVKHSVVCAAHVNCTECPLYDKDTSIFEDCHYYEERGC